MPLQLPLVVALAWIAIANSLKSREGVGGGANLWQPEPGPGTAAGCVLIPVSTDNSTALVIQVVRLLICLAAYG